jgi:ElaA protein
MTVPPPASSDAPPGAPPTPAAGPIAWAWSDFASLTVGDLYAAIQLRQAVFVVEQECPYLDADGSDPAAWHLLGWAAAGAAGDAGAERVLVAYARVFPPGVKYAEASIGRVISSPLVRRTGLGRSLMDEAIRRCTALAPGSAIRIGAQMRLERFYEALGFRRVSEPYDEDGIMHVEMLRDP